MACEHQKAAFLKYDFASFYLPKYLPSTYLGK